MLYAFLVVFVRKKNFFLIYISYSYVLKWVGELYEIKKKNERKKKQEKIIIINK